ncbi:alpha/beta fold hydrolase [Bradyrhizobium sp. USDA 223]|uniref:alpha/beta fold hydrolase n=1 Tax=Bradyrhizobium sp. USDA 223 TaxID=3156306 RepID=UPI0038330C2A
MHKDVNQTRRAFIGAAAALATGIGLTGPAAAHLSQVAEAADATSASLGHLKQINAGILNVGYTDNGPEGGPAVLLLHGWPYDIDSFAEVVPLLTAQGYRVIVPYLRGYGTTRFLSAASARNAQPSALAADMIALMDALKIEKAVVAGFDWGARTANIMAALWPERVSANQQAGKVPLSPKAELEWWYQFYFATERGRIGYDKHRREFAKLIWKLASPKWEFDDATFERSAKAFDNADHVAIVIHNYRWRLGLVDGEEAYDELEAQLALAPTIGVPTITMEGDANGAPHPQPAVYAKKFTGMYEHRHITGGIGHNLPQEAPNAFAQAILDVAAQV